MALEVLSPSTEGWDRGGKFLHLGQAPALQHYVLVAQDASLIEVYTRAGPESWELRRYGAGQRAPLPAAGIEIDVDAAYRNLPAEPA